MHRTPAAAYNFRSTPPTAPTTLPLSLPPWPAGVITARRNTYPLLSFLYLPAHVSIYLSANHFIGRSITAGSCDAAAAAANYVIGKVTAACAACNSAATAKSHAPLPRQFFPERRRDEDPMDARNCYAKRGIFLLHVFTTFRSMMNKSLTKGDRSKDESRYVVRMDRDT